MAYRRWYTSYFNTEIGRIGFGQNRNAFCKLLWKLWSPTWRFTEEEYQRTALSFGNPDFVVTVIHEYRHRYANAQAIPHLPSWKPAWSDSLPSWPQQWSCPAVWMGLSHPHRLMIIETGS